MFYSSIVLKLSGDIAVETDQRSGVLVDAENGEVWGEQLILLSMWKSQSQLTRLNALERLINVMYSGICCSLHFSRIRRSVKTISMVDLPDWKLHYDLG